MAGTCGVLRKWCEFYILEYLAARRTAGEIFPQGQSSCWWSVVPSVVPDGPRRGVLIPLPG